MDTLFELGRLVCTHTVHRELSSVQIASVVIRHSLGDWNEMSAHDREANEAAVAQGDFRILSSFAVSGRDVWVITEADRSSTTVLFADEY